MREIVIDSTAGYDLLKTRQTSDAITCAFQKKDCSAHCSACEQIENDLYCNRNGHNNKFIIGVLKQK